jgi:diguanylate cyclase (GGDEF)-like protein
MKISNSEHRSKTDKLKHHFTIRVSNQARATLDLWSVLHKQSANNHHLQDLITANKKLLNFAQRFQSFKFSKIAEQLHAVFESLNENEPLNSQQLDELNELMLQLGHLVLRRDDNNKSGAKVTVKKPLYFALNDAENALLLAQQIEYFGIITTLCNSSDELDSAINSRHPLAIVIDINFQGPNNGLKIIQKYLDLESDTPKIPVIFYSAKPMSFIQKLQCLRLGGISSLENLTSQAVVNELEKLINLEPEKLFRVLIVDDSRLPIMHTERILNAAGMITKSVMNPIDVWDVLESFQPDVILMDLYMPHCSGIELAKLIRQDNNYINTPIIYLSGEEDKNRQLLAMEEGGEDFLTKPVNKKHLLSTIRTRGLRARELNHFIIRDSLTGLYNHTHILKILDDQIKIADSHKIPLCFIMLDIDHFKLVNDNNGHQVGDDVIKNLAIFLSQRLRKTDLVGRYGGEEFAIVLPNTNIENATLVMDEIRHNFSHLLHGGSSAINATFSCGVARYNGQTSSELIEQADQAMYAAKKAGRNCVKYAKNKPYSF